jgi:hypothetical protein
VRFETAAESWYEIVLLGSVLFSVLTSAFPTRLASALDGLLFAENSAIPPAEGLS